MKGKNKKGQVVFEFVIAAIFFFYIVFYVINYLNTTAVIFANDFYVNSLEFKALHASELLLHNKGVWNGSVPTALGLADDWPVLNSTKIQYLDSYCGTSPANPNYQTMIRKLDINHTEGHGMKIEINDTGGNLLVCGYLPQGRVSARMSRFAISEIGEYLFFIIWVW